MAMTVPFPVQQLLTVFRESKSGEMWIDYDEEADTLYVNFQRPIAADHAEINENDTILRYQGNQLVGFTVLNASSKNVVEPAIR